MVLDEKGEGALELAFRTPIGYCAFLVVASTAPGCTAPIEQYHLFLSCLVDAHQSCALAGAERRVENFWVGCCRDSNACQGETGARNPAQEHQSRRVGLQHGFSPGAMV